MTNGSTRRARISMAESADRSAIYAMRHEVYARELGQYAVNERETLSDALDDFNEYVVAHAGEELVGFISITPPGHGRYSIDKYVRRDELALAFDDGLYELRVLTVARKHRNSRLAATLMYAAGRWVEEQGGRHIVAMGRTEIVSIYLKHGLRTMNRQVQCGAVTFELMETDVLQLRGFAERHHQYYSKLYREVLWEVDFPFFKAECCFHGGAFFEAIGPGFERLELRRTIINADVLDAWFPPSPKAIEALREHLPWLLRTSPPTQSEGLRDAIARSRGVDPGNILPGAGSSDLIYMALRHWLNKDSRVLILNPMYGEYAHVLERVIGCEVHRLNLSRRNGYAVVLNDFIEEMRRGYDLVVLVNPNNPTGQHISRIQLESALGNVPARTRVWIDEAYVEYAGPGQSLERFAAQSENVIVCKTMSKSYALSGARVGYLCAGRHQLAELVPLTPPWAVSLPSQVAAVRALEDEGYYAARYADTRRLRADLVLGLRQLGIREIIPGVANFVLFHLEQEHPEADELVRACRRSGVFMRDISLMGTNVGLRGVRTAVKDGKSNAVILETLGSVLEVASNMPTRA